MRSIRGPLRRRPAAALALGLAASLAAGAGPAAASVTERGTFSNSESFTWDDCGFDVDGTATVGGRFLIRAGSGPDASAFYAHTNFWSREEHVPSNGGRTVIIELRQLYQDTTGRRIEGNVFEFTAKVPGTRVARLEDGTVLFRDAGVITQRYRIDTGGDSTPGGTGFDLLDYSWSGPHPGETTDLCDLF